MEFLELREEMVALGRKLYQRDLICATEGNFSVRVDDYRVLATPSGLCKGELRLTDLVLIDLQGNHLEGPDWKVSSEILMHLEVYRQRPDVRAVVHAHPPYCIALMLAGKGLDRPILAENVILLGKVPIAPYAQPSTPQVPAAIREYIHHTDCLLLDHHGSLTVGRSLQEAFYKLELME
ncbi:MAG: class II aldolase/adducin family protein, partial [Calditrichaeota bacterium]